MIIRADFWIYIFLIFGVSHITSFAQAQPYQEAKLVRKVLEIYQPKSFTMQREYCGYFYEDNRGKLLVGPVAAGTYASCTLDVPQYGEIVASWHTHGSADATGIAEIPSFQDIQTDI